MAAFISATLVWCRTVSLGRSGPDWWLLVSQIVAQGAGAYVPQMSHMHLCIFVCWWSTGYQHRSSLQISYYFIFSCFGTSECWRFSKTPVVIRTGDKKMQPHGKNTGQRQNKRSLSIRPFHHQSLISSSILQFTWIWKQQSKRKICISFYSFANVRTEVMF